MYRLIVLAVASAAACMLTGPAAAAASSSVAALQVALRAHGQYGAAVDGIDGPLTRSALTSFQRKKGIRATGNVGPATRCAFGALGKPLLGQRQLSVGAVGWDVSSLEFKLVPFGLTRSAVDGRFTKQTAKALRRLQKARGLPADGIAGPQTFRALSRPSRSTARPSTVSRTLTPSVAPMHVVAAGESFFSIARQYGISPFRLAQSSGLSLSSVIVPGQRLKLPSGVHPVVRPVAPTHLVTPGESFFSIAQRYGVSPLLLAKASGLSLSSVIVPGQRLTLPSGTRVTADGAAAPSASVVATRDAVRASLDHWSAVYGVDPSLARATAWMESGFQEDVVSNVGAVGVMQLLPETWRWVDQILLGTVTPRTYDGNVRAGVRYLRWLLDEFGGDRRLALAGYYQGARAVRERGIFKDTKRYVTIILELYGSV